MVLAMSRLIYCSMEGGLHHQFEIALALGSYHPGPRTQTNNLDKWLKMVWLHPREFWRQILSLREFQAASNKRCLHSVHLDISLLQHVTYVIILNLEK